MNFITRTFGGKTLKNSAENVCFKGGGMTGNAFVGVDRAMTELELWPRIKRFIGSSAGAIFASCAACRVPYKVMADIISGTDFSKFCDSEWGIAGDAERILEHMGIHSGDYFYNWFKNVLETTINDPDITFEGVYTRFGSELVITTTDLTTQSLVYLDRENCPNSRICDAVRKSMSIPGFFAPVCETTDIKHVYVDGGCTNNFPLHYFDKLYKTPQEAMLKTIGFNLESTGTTPSAPTNIVELMIALIYTDTAEIEQLRLDAKDRERMIMIPTFGLSFVDFSMSKDDIQRLMDSGYNSVMKFFNAELT